MTDIERLRHYDDPGDTTCAEAADEIERLRAKIYEWNTIYMDDYRPNARMAAEIKRLRVELAEEKARYLEAYIREAETQIERLRAENAQLRRDRDACGEEIEAMRANKRPVVITRVLTGEIELMGCTDSALPPANERPARPVGFADLDPIEAAKATWPPPVDKE